MRLITLLLTLLLSFGCAAQYPADDQQLMREQAEAIRKGTEDYNRVFDRLSSGEEDIFGPFFPEYHEEIPIFINPVTHNIVFYVEGNKISFENRGKDSSCHLLTKKGITYTLPVPYGRGAIIHIDGELEQVMCSNTKEV